MTQWKDVRCVGRSARPMRWEIGTVIERLESRVLLDAVFGTPLVLQTGFGPTCVAVADFNADGKSDLTVANGSTVSTMLGNGDGTFEPGTTYAVAHPADYVTVADFNGDGRSDLAVANNTTVSILLGNGNGTFQPRTDNAVLTRATSLAVADLNQDGKSDLAVAYWNRALVGILLGNGDGTFQTAVNFIPSIYAYPCSGPGSVVAADFNNDSLIDLAVTGRIIIGSSVVSILLGNGDGTFQPGVTYDAIARVISSPVFMTVGDFDRDGNSDLAVAHDRGLGFGMVTVLMGDGNGAFPNRIDLDSFLPSSLAVGDFDGDGRSDLVAPLDIAYADWVSIMLGNGNGTFQPKTDYHDGGLGAKSVAVGDFNGDGRDDLAVTNVDGRTVSIMLNAGTFDVPTAFSNLNPSTTIPCGTPQITFSGTVTANGTPIPNGQMVTVTINGVARSILTAGGKGHFSLNFPTSSLPISATPYPITYSYAGYAHFMASIDSSTMLTVDKASLMVITNPQSKAYGQVNPVLTGTLSGIAIADGITVSYSTTATQFSHPGSYPITATLSDPNNKLGNYTVTNAGGTLTITKANQTITWAAPTPITDNTPLSDAQLNATITGVAGGSAPSPLVYIPPAGTTLIAGIQTLTVSADATTDYNAAIARVLITVSDVNVTPTDITLSPSSISEHQPAGTTIGTLSTTDPDVGDTFTYSLVNGTGSSDNASFTISGNQLLAARSFDYEAASSHQIRVQTTDQDGLSFEKAFTISVDNVNEVPTDISLSNNSVAEAQPSDTVVGTLTTTDSDADDRFVYALVSGTGGSDNDLFSIASNTLKTAAVFNYDARTNYSIRIRSTDVGGLSIESVFAVTVTNVNQAPTDVALNPAFIAENQPAGTVVGNVSGSDPDAGDSFTYSLVSGAGSGDNASFQIAGNQLQTAASLDFEANSSYSIRLRTTDSGGLSFEKVFTISVTNVNEAPTDITLSNSSIPENRPAGTSVGTLAATDPDIGNSLTYSLVGGAGSTDNASFTISGNTLRAAASFDFEARSSYSIRVRATDQGGLSTENAFTIRLSNLNETPTAIALSSAPVPEHQPAGTVVGSLSSSDPDAGDTFTYTLVSGVGSTDNASFTIAANQLKTARAFDFEVDKGSYSIRIRSTDAGGLHVEKAFTITLSNVNENPADLTLSNTSVTENQPGGTVVATLATTDPDTADNFTYTLVGGAGGEGSTGSDDNERFTISGSSLLTASSFDFEDRNSYSIYIRSTDAGGLYVEKAFTITVTNLNDAPTDLALSNTSLAENQPSGTVVGTLWGSDPDAGETFTYALVGGSGGDDNDRFTINGNELLTAASFDYEGQNTFSIRIRGTDAEGLYLEKVFVIDVSNMNEAPTNLTLSSTTIQENLPSGTVVGDLSCLDPDTDGNFTYSLIDGSGDEDNASFLIDAGQLITSMRFNYELRTSYSILVRATDSGGLSTEQVLRIEISDAPADYRGAFGWNGGKKATKLTLTDTDGDLVTFTLKGSGMGNVYGYQDTFEDLIMTGTGPTTAVSINVKKFKMKGHPGGDGLITIGNLSTDGLIKNINAPAAILSGLTQLNTQDQLPGKVTVSLNLCHISDSDIRVQNLPVSSIAVKGDVSNSRILASNSIKKLTMATLLDSEILVGVQTSFEEDFATSASDFANPTAWLGDLKISGRKLPSKAPHPADVSNTHISAPSVGTLTLMNVADTADPMVHVANDLGTLKVTQSKLVNQPMFPIGTWKTPDTRPTLWQVL